MGHCSWGIRFSSNQSDAPGSETGKAPGLPVHGCRPGHLDNPSGPPDNGPDRLLPSPLEVEERR